MKKRPLSVSIIGWYEIVSSGLGLIGLGFTLYAFTSPNTRQIMANLPLPIGIQLTISSLGPLIFLACGIGLLRRSNWARYLLTGWSLFSLAIGLYAAPARWWIAPSVAIFALKTFYLFRRAANAWFTGDDRDEIGAVFE